MTVLSRHSRLKPFNKKQTHLSTQLIIWKEVRHFLNVITSVILCVTSSGLPATALLTEVKTKILSFFSWLPTVFCLLNPKLKMRHWETLQCCIGGQIGKEPNVTIQQLNELKVMHCSTAIAFSVLILRYMYVSPWC